MYDQDWPRAQALKVPRLMGPWLQTHPYTVTVLDNSRRLWISNDKW